MSEFLRRSRRRTGFGILAGFAHKGEGGVLAKFNSGLVVSIDAEKGAGEGGGRFKEENELANGVGINLREQDRKAGTLINHQGVFGGLFLGVEQVAQILFGKIGKLRAQDLGGAGILSLRPWFWTSRKVKTLSLGPSR